MERAQVTDMDLLWWLVELARGDRAQYREIRELMWRLYAENSGRSDKPSKLS